MRILGISAFYHDSAAAILVDGEIVAAAQEERFSRVKHDAGFPAQAIRYCLQEANLVVADLDAVAFYDKPFLKFERLLETYYAFAPRGIRSFLTAMPVWLKEKLFLKRLLKKELTQLGDFDSKKLKLLFPEHHLSHAASAFYPSNFPEAAILTIDGVGEWATTTIGFGQGDKISVLKELRFPHSLGLLYSAFTYFLGFKVNSGEYKVMGLAPYGNIAAETTQKYISIIKSELADIKEDGSVWLNPVYFSFATSLKMIPETKWERLFNLPKRYPESTLDQPYCDLALALQQVTEEIILKLAYEAKRLTNSDNLVLAGGVALNSVANGKLQNCKIFKNIFIQPAAGDAGGALGAALAAHHIYFNQPRKINPELADGLRGSYLGPAFSEDEILKTAKSFKANFQYFENTSSLLQKTAGLLASGNCIGWFQGRMEFGPRALGNRSILADARNLEMQKKLNLNIKYRESFRPFAPAVLAVDASEYFDLPSSSPYMLLVQPLTAELRQPLPGNYGSLPLPEKLYYQRSKFPAITHIDFSARIQTVHPETNPLFYSLLQEFKYLTGCSLLVNTSFNVRGEPIVCSPADAYTCFMRTEMDYLVMGNYLFAKTDQPTWPEQNDWQTQYGLD